MMELMPMHKFISETKCIFNKQFYLKLNCSVQKQ